MKADYIYRDVFNKLLSALMPENRLAIEVSLCTGLRISDVLNLRSAKLKDRMTVRELKTGKNKRITIPRKLLDELHSIKGKIYVFEGRTDPQKHRTRQAVFKDIKRAAALFRVPAKLIISPHTARKIYAVSQFQRTCDLKAVKQLLNHSNEAVTVLYAIADRITDRRLTTRERANVERLRGD